jgi:hypothetical protein
MFPKLISLYTVGMLLHICGKTKLIMAIVGMFHGA